MCVIRMASGRLVADLFAQFDLGAALKRALGGGLSGAAAMVLQVLLLMVRDGYCFLGSLYPLFGPRLIFHSLYELS